MSDEPAVAPARSGPVAGSTGRLLLPVTRACQLAQVRKRVFKIRDLRAGLPAVQVTVVQ